MIKTSGIGEGKVYRSSSPVNPEIGRDTYAMKATEDHGIKTIVNLADTEKEVEDRNTYKDSYYSKQKVIAVGLNVDFNSTDFKEGLAKAIHGMAEGEAPYLIHCNEGKDRAGYLSALIECLMGASLDEVLDDYMITYYNYYNVVLGTEKYNAIRDKRIIKQLEAAFGVTDLSNGDLSKLCEKYLFSIGITEEDIQKLKSKLQ
jgi:protein tyrosine/serine phosphatase